MIPSFNLNSFFGRSLSIAVFFGVLFCGMMEVSAGETQEFNTDWIRMTGKWIYPSKQMNVPTLKVTGMAQSGTVSITSEQLYMTGTRGAERLNQMLNIAGGMGVKPELFQEVGVGKTLKDGYETENLTDKLGEMGVEKIQTDEKKMGKDIWDAMNDEDDSVDISDQFGKAKMQKKQSGKDLWDKMSDDDDSDVAMQILSKKKDKMGFVNDPAKQSPVLSKTKTDVMKKVIFEDKEPELEKTEKKVTTKKVNAETVKKAAKYSF